MNRRLQSIVEPRSPERLALNQERWSTLPEAVRTPQQAAGRSYVSCGATHGVMERCNFGCTSCYLSDVANATPPLPHDEAIAQLDELRAHLGPAGKAQITSGEVTLLEPAELGRLVDHARAIGLDPMVMTNGERFLELPDYLPGLVRDHGLEKISIHIDSTQRGRAGMKPDATESDHHRVRERFARLIRDVRRQTGRKLHAAQTMTVTHDNLADVPGVMRWILDNVDAFRMVSFQPVAEVGRTRDRRTRGDGSDGDDLGLDGVWSRICQGVGQPLNRDAMHFGDRRCNIICPVVVVSIGGVHRIIQCCREDNRWDRRMMRRILDRFGGFSVVGATGFESVLKIASLLLRAPGFVLEALAYGLYRLLGVRRLLFDVVTGWLRGRRTRIRPLAIIVHRFMNAQELDTPEGRERLASCVLRLPVDGRMVPMCEMNASGMRRDLNLRQAPRSEPGNRWPAPGAGAQTG